MPVARKVWQPIAAAMPAAAARRRIIRQASGWLIGLADSVVPLWPRPARNRPALPVLSDAGRVGISSQRPGQRMVARQRVLLAAFLMQPDRPSGAARGGFYYGPPYHYYGGGS